MSLEILQAKNAIREVFDTYTFYSDEGRLEDYKELFSADATVIIYMGEQLAFELKGTDKVIETFKAFTGNVVKQHHMNGQLVLKIDGNKASGIGYCEAHLVSNEEGKLYITEHCIRYEDNYIFEDGKWVISHRISRFNISDKRLLGV